MTIISTFFKVLKISDRIYINMSIKSIKMEFYQNLKQPGISFAFLPVKAGHISFIPSRHVTVRMTDILEWLTITFNLTKFDHWCIKEV